MSRRVLIVLLVLLGFGVKMGFEMNRLAFSMFVYQDTSYMNEHMPHLPLKPRDYDLLEQTT